MDESLTALSVDPSRRLTDDERETMARAVARFTGLERFTIEGEDLH